MTLMTLPDFLQATFRSVWQCLHLLLFVFAFAFVILSLDGYAVAFRCQLPFRADAASILKLRLNANDKHSKHTRLCGGVARGGVCVCVCMTWGYAGRLAATAYSNIELTAWHASVVSNLRGRQNDNMRSSLTRSTVHFNVHTLTNIHIHMHSVYTLPAKAILPNV